MAAIGPGSRSRLQQTKETWAMRRCSFGLFFGLAVLISGTGQAATVVFSASGATAADIQGTVDGVRTALGNLNPNQPQNFPDGRREVNWDGVPDAISDPNPFPGDTFNSGNPGTARGIEFVPTGISTGLEVSASAASGIPPEFGMPDFLTVFSPQKLFRSTGGSTIDTLFFDPSDQVTPATTRGLAVIFTGLPGLADPTMTFYSFTGSILAQESVAITAAAGLSVLGVIFDDPLVARVAIDTGGSAVMDDFIYGEPAPIPLPGGLPLLGLGLATLLALRRRVA
jgi:hypothetical protein